MTTPTIAEVAGKLSDAQRRRLLEWPYRGSTFRAECGPDRVAYELCNIGIGNIRPWKHGCQMALMPLGLKVSAYLESQPLQGTGE